MSRRLRAASIGFIAALALAASSASDPVRSAASRPRRAGDARPDVAALEQETSRAINRIRRDAGLEALTPSEDLAAIARAHSEYQARVRRSSHVGLGGRGPADRVRAGGIAYRALAENVAMNLGHEDPVRTAIDSWMSSAGHRKNILEARFRRTGVGVAIATDGAVYFTQLFLAPPD